MIVPIDFLGKHSFLAISTHLLFFVLLFWSTSLNSSMPLEVLLTVICDQKITFGFRPQVLCLFLTVTIRSFAYRWALSLGTHPIQESLKLKISIVCDKAYDKLLFLYSRTRHALRPFMVSHPLLRTAKLADCKNV